MDKEGVQRIPDETVNQAREAALSLRGGFSSPSTQFASLLILAPPATTSNFGISSPVSPPSLGEVGEQIKRKVENTDARLHCTVKCITDDFVDNNLVSSANLIVSLASNDNDLPPALREALVRRKFRAEMDKATLSFVEDSKLDFVATFDPAGFSPSSVVPWTSVASKKRLYEYTQRLLRRETSDDAMTGCLLVLNQLTFPIPWVQHSIDPSWEKGPAKNAKEFYDMVTKCGDCVAACVQDEQCKACLDALDSIDTRDQVESYRAITSFER